jgi:hypothetical protein
MAEKTLGQVAYANWCAEASNRLMNTEEAWQAVADAVVAAHEARRWQAIESAPKDKEVDVWDGCERVPDAKYNTQTESWFSDVFSYGDMDWREMDPQPTHWTPIPAPPQEVE